MHKFAGNMTYRKLTLLIFIIILAVSTLIYGVYGLLGSCLCIFFSAPLWSGYYANRSQLSLDELKSNTIIFFKYGFMRTVVLAILNLTVFFTIGKHTLVPKLFLVYFLVAFSGYLYAYIIKKRVDNYFYGLGLFPFCLSLLFIINMTISFNPVKEEYKYSIENRAQIKENNRDRFRISTRIILKPNTYEEYPGIRSFMNENDLEGTKITYTISRGVLGFRVLKEYEFGH